VFVIPSGNLGNLTAGLMARAMGLPVRMFVAATNANDVFPEYLRTGEFRPRASLHTLSNAMDVGNPSNLARIRALFKDDVAAIREAVDTESCTDEKTLAAVRNAFDRHGYVFDPHGAVGYYAARQYLHTRRENEHAVILATAHPAKFPEALTDEMRLTVSVPKALSDLAHRPRKVQTIRAHYEELKSILEST
jgi:threonine synthase